MKTNLVENRHIRIFLSSTFRDMQDERDYLMKRTFPKLRKIAAEHSAIITAVDLRWGITEEESKSGKVVDICLHEIENSIPFFVGIIGNRYGWIPNRKDIEDSTIKNFTDVNRYLQQGISVTEMEMQFGVLGRPEDMHAYFFIKEEENDADNPEMLKRLKEQVLKSKYPSTTYSSVENLAEQVEAAFVKLLDDLYPIEQHPTELQKDIIAQRTFHHELQMAYVKNESMFKALDEWLEGPEMQANIIGNIGCGKSALVANWLETVGSQYTVIHHTVGQIDSDYSYVKRILSQCICDKCGLEYNPQETIQQVLEKCSDRHVLLVVDGVNKITTPKSIAKDEEINEPLLEKDIHGVKVLFTSSRNEPNLGIIYNPDDVTTKVIKMPLLSVDERKAIVEKYLSLYAKKLTDKQINTIINDSQCGVVLILHDLLWEIINFGSFEKLDKKIASLLKQNEPENFYKAIIKSYEKSYDKDLVKKVLSLINMSQSFGLTEDEIIDVSGVKPLEWSMIRCAIDNHISSTLGRVSFSNFYFERAVRETYTRYNDCSKLRQRLIDHLCNIDPVKNAHLISLLCLYQDIDLQNYHKTDYDHILENLRLQLSIDQKCSNVSQRTIAQEHVQIGKVLVKKNELDSALDEFISAGCIYEKTPTIDPIYLADTMENIAHIYEEQKNYKEALNAYLRSLKEQKKTLKEFRPGITDVMDSIGKTYQKLKEYDKALEYFTKSLELKKKNLGPESENPEYAFIYSKSYNYLAMLYYDMGNDEMGDKYALLFSQS